MKLYYNPASPYARKARVVMLERDLAGRVECVKVQVSPVSPHAEVAAANPLGKIPVLALEDGSALYDSRVIAEYLDDLAGPVLFPAPGPQRWAALTLQAAADGLLDAALLIRYERNLRAAGEQSAAWIEAQFVKLRAALDWLEAAALDPAAPGIGEIAVGCALGYLDFRFPGENWRSRHPRLAAFQAAFADRPSMAATVPAG